MKIIGTIWIFAVVSLTSCYAQNETEMKEDSTMAKTDAEWKDKLTQEQYFILRQSGTERPGTGEYNLHFKDGVYRCAGCDAELFTSDSKFESHCGWPSFDKAKDENTIIEIKDKTHGMVRTEIRCANCGGHLGHVFEDGPTETGLRYCINSGALDFESENEIDTDAKKEE